MFSRISKLFLILGAIFLVTGSVEAQRLSTLQAEKLLSGMGYWLTRADGRADASTRHAIMAFQKVEGLKRTGTLDASTARALLTASRPQPKYTGDRHIEVDITRQVLFVVDADGRVTHILPVSSGSGKKYFDQGMWQTARTPRGAMNIGAKINGVRRAPLGNLYYPMYFAGGVAIHGSNSIPATPQSHGCVRIPRFADKALFKMIPLDTLVYVYD
ncbi:MAG: L,D-transpeptidase family protein [Acidobacteriota bacterium]